MTKNVSAMPLRQFSEKQDRVDVLLSTLTTEYFRSSLLALNPVSLALNPVSLAPKPLSLALNAVSDSISSFSQFLMSRLGSFGRPNYYKIISQVKSYSLFQMNAKDYGKTNILYCIFLKIPLESYIIFSHNPETWLEKKSSGRWDNPGSVRPLTDSELKGCRSDCTSAQFELRPCSLISTHTSYAHNIKVSGFWLVSVFELAGPNFVLLYL